MRPADLLILALVVSAWAAAPAYAQSTRRPDLNLFGRGLREPEQQLGVNGSLGASFYDTITPQAVLPGRAAPPDHGWGSFGSASLSYNLKLANITFDGSVGSFASYYPRLAKPFRARAFPGAGMGTSWGYQLSPKATFSLGASMRYRPLALESVLPGAFGGIGGGGDIASDATMAFLPRDLDEVEGNYLAASTDAGLSYAFSRRWSLSGNYRVQRDFAFGTVERSGLWTQEAGTALHFAVTRNLSVRGGYRYYESHHGAGRPFRGHGADLGVDYGRGAALQLTRRTTLVFGAGAGGYVDRAGNQRYRVNGNAGLQHQMGRTWSSSVTYVRGLEAAQLLFQEPLLTDTVSAGINGLINRRLGFNASGAAQRGSVGLVGDGKGLVRVMASTGLQTALGRHFAIGLNYSIYRFHFESQIVRPPGVPARSSSQGVSVHLSTWASIFQRGRSNATR